MLQKSLLKKEKQLAHQLQTASKIQNMLLIPPDRIQQILPESFVFYKPSELVGGDFYWLGQENGQLILASIDCTGRGVAGAMMTMIVNALLTQIVNQQKITSPDEILTLLHSSLLERVPARDSFSREGIEASICSIDLHKRIVEFAGAKSSLIYFQDEQMHELEGTPVSLGSFWSHYEASRTFRKQSITLKSNTPTTFYMATDGYEDQFGGEKGRKFLKNRLRETLTMIHQEALEKQPIILQQIIEDWMKNQKQVDDMLIMGFRL